MRIPPRSDPAGDVGLLAAGDWPRQRLRTSWVASSHRLDPSQREAVHDAWADALAQPGVALFNGAQCRLESWSTVDGALGVALSRTCYQDYLGTNAAHPQWAERHGPGVLANPLGTSVALESGDGRLVFGRRGQAVALYPGQPHPFGGTLEPPEPGGTVDLIAEMQREISEEIGLAAADLDDLRAIALTEDRRLRQPELVYAARCPLPCAEIERRLDLHEHSACWTLPATAAAVAATLTGGAALTPVLRATLIGWGVWRFGARWLHDA
jgi:hypothetical protein